MQLTRVLSGFAKPLPAPRETAAERVASGARRVCDEAVELVKRWEGCELHAYHDAIGLPTQGYGRLLSREKGADLSQWPDIDQATAEDWLRQDLDKFAQGVARLLPVPLNDNEFGALVSLSFNIGLGNLQASTLRRMLLRDESREDCARQFIRWNKAGGRVLRGLTKRRAEEAALFVS